MIGVLIHYNRRNGDRVVKVFRNPKDALEDRGFRRNVGRIDPVWETVIILSDSLESVEHTHSRYFSGRDRTRELAPRFG